MDLKIKDVAELLNVSETTIRRWLNDGKIPAYRLNSQYRFNRLEIEDWVMGQKLKVSQNIPLIVDLKSPVTPPVAAPLVGGSKQFSLYRAIHKGGVYSQVPGKTKEEVIRATMKLISSKLGFDADVVGDLLLDREKMHSTGLNNGIAIPHTRDFLLSDHFDGVAVVFPQHPIPYDALDGKPVHTLFFLFACDDRHHLHLLAKIAHLSSQPATLQLLQEHPNKDKLLSYIKEWESSIQQVQDAE